MSQKSANSAPVHATGSNASPSGIGILNRAYYWLKPFLPQRLRYSMRRLRARYKLRTNPDWPIMESAGRTPDGWPGWPERKKFALVLTHDVEGQVGVDRCRALAKLESNHGFRSSFNFIPEGEYAVSAQLRADLASEGFEIGVHDLHHDGSLYRSPRSFSKAAGSINRYLKEWGAVGFRAGFMFHNLEWLKQLEIEYDASTFDTDPFEPQPDGVGTIFPFWVQGPNPGQGYVELPYSLPQDSTVFLIFRNRAIDVWKKKLDWVAAHGGMALLNIHPDYVSFGGDKLGISEFPAAFYEEFLNYAKARYGGTYWQALPRDVARFVRSHQIHPLSSQPGEKNPQPRISPDAVDRTQRAMGEP